MNREDLAIFPHTPQYQTIYNPTLVHPMSAFVSRSSCRNNQLQRNKLNRLNVEHYFLKRQHDQRHISLPRALLAVKKQQIEQQRRGSYYKEATISIVYPDSKLEDSNVSKIDKSQNLQNHQQGVQIDPVEEKKTNTIDLKKSISKFKDSNKTKTLLNNILRGYYTKIYKILKKSKISIIQLNLKLYLDLVQYKQNDVDKDNFIQIMGLQIKASKLQEQQSIRTKAYSQEKEREQIKPQIEKKESTTRSVQKRRESPYNKTKNVSQQSMRSNQNFRFSMNDYSSLSRDQLFQIKLLSYHHFLFMVSTQSNFYIVPSNNLIELKFKVGKGNNSLLIKETFKQRWWWTLNQEAENKELNFIWTQIKVPQFMNLQEWSKESILTRQKSLSTTSTEFKRIKKPQSPKSQKKTSRFGKFDDPLQKLMNDQDVNELKNIDKSIQDFLKYAEKKEFKIIDNINKIHNHIERNYHLGNKKAMFHNMKKFYELTKQELFQHLPVTFHVSGVKDKSYIQFLEYYKEKKGNGIWIVKPGEFTNRGNGIIVCQNLNEIHRIVSKKQNHPNGKPFTYLIQKYIEKPFLYNKRKFDIRCYFLITQLNNIIRAYWYEEGYLRTSSEEFDIKDVINNNLNFELIKFYQKYSHLQYVHLTNDAIQKYSEAYGKYENGNKLSFAEFQRYLDKWHYNDHFDFYNDLYPQLKMITLNAIKSVYHKIEPYKKNYNFEIFGLDFMIDEKFKPYLIEINTNPCLELSSPLLGRIIPAMVENAFRLSIDTLVQMFYLNIILFCLNIQKMKLYQIIIIMMISRSHLLSVPPPESSAWPPNKKHLLFYDNLLENNRFQLLFDEKDDGLELKNLYSNQINDDQIDEMNEEEEEYKSDDD